MSEISENLHRKIINMKTGKNVYSVGRVTAVNGIILEVAGLEDASYFERVELPGKGFGYVDTIGRKTVKVALMHQEAPIRIGDDVISTGKQIRAEFSKHCRGKLVDIFGEDLLNGKKMDDCFSVEIETDPIPIMDRTAVNRPMLTGIIGIDMMYPIGRGQRQLIIGDKKTGKTQIALDAIVNQKNQDVLCIYVALGKTKKEVKSIYEQLERHGALEYSIVIAAFNDNPSPLMKYTPYAALSLAERFMRSSADVLVVIDDLKRHADCCREIALLQGNTPGRDAYPPDIFYSHSRMLEKGCQHKCGGSITILPICETRGGDITDYISTNIISITDGQIVLSKKSFDKGQKPAVNYGLSVSRLGGAVQTREMKKAGSKMRQELLSYLEQKEVYELANMDEMSEDLRNRMIKGQKMLDNLVQYKFDVKTSEEMLSIVDRLNKAV